MRRKEQQPKSTDDDRVCAVRWRTGVPLDPTWRESARPLAKWSWEEERIDARGRGEWDRSHPGKLK